MAPAKRKLRKGNKASSASVLEDDKLQNLRDYIADFDKQVESRIQMLEREAETLQKTVENSFRIEFLKINKSIRDMKWVDFVACDGDTDKKLEEQIEFAVPALPPPKKKQGTTTGKKPRASRAKRFSKAAGTSAMETPAAGASGKISSFTITPKVSLKHFTPSTAFREANVGEVTFSTKGSPVTLKPIKQKIFNMMDGRPSELDPQAIPKLDEEGIAQLKDLHQKLSCMLRMNVEDNAED